MIKFKVSRDKRKPVSKEEVSQYVFKQLVGLWKDCVSAFIMEAIQHVHVDTGMSEASFYNLATNVKLASAVMANIAGKGPRPPRLYYDHQPGVKKSIPLGKELGSEKGKAYDLAFGDTKDPHFLFMFKIVVYQYKLHEYGQQEWNSLEFGKAAFLTTWHANYKNRVHTKKLLGFLVPR